ncbi:MAG: beta-methylgalactoside transporter inner membrane component [Spirochaetes bacterium ADurb.Bin110]|nr:MAG: beta-methylgalactoside transporter inner membrane component [Spirochaetes bacterium ADurb.Bin110]
MRNQRAFLATLRVLLAATFSIFLAATVLLLFAADFRSALWQFFVEPFSSRYFFGNYIADTVPLIISGIGVSIAFRSRNFNLGGEGQIYVGALAGGVLALHISEAFGSGTVWILVAFIGAFTGAIIGTISGLLKAYWRISEMISSYLLSAIIINISDFLITGPLQDSTSNFQTTAQIPSAFLLPRIFSPSKLDISIWLALFLILFFHILSKKSKIGFELRVCGENEEFARYCGISIRAYKITAMAISGGMYGLSGALLVIGQQGRVMRGFSSGLGWSAISVALLAQGSETAILPAALFIAFLKAGSDHVMIGSGVPSEIISILQAAAMLFITAQVMPKLRQRRKQQ